MKRKRREGVSIETEYEDLGDEDNGSMTGGISPYITSDLGCAAALDCRGFPVLELDRSDSQRVKFLFQRTRDVMSVVAAYWDCSLGVDAQSYFGSIRRLKNRLHSDD